MDLHYEIFPTIMTLQVRHKWNLNFGRKMLVLIGLFVSFYGYQSHVAN
jgi:hypothetical protein